jgi:hypothetical protein
MQKDSRSIQGANQEVNLLSLLFCQPANYKDVFHELAQNNNTIGVSKSCYCRNCSNIATTSIQLPINDKLACLLDVCKDCLPKFLPKEHSKQ